MVSETRTAPISPNTRTKRSWHDVVTQSVRWTVYMSCTYPSSRISVNIVDTELIDDEYTRKRLNRDATLIYDWQEIISDDAQPVKLFVYMRPVESHMPCMWRWWSSHVMYQHHSDWPHNLKLIRSSIPCSCSYVKWRSIVQCMPPVIDSLRYSHIMGDRVPSACAF